MKRIKCEEIQNTIQNYVRHRDLSSGNSSYLNKFTSTTTTSSSTSKKSSGVEESTLMALNDLALIESSVCDYHSFSFDHLSSAEYIKQLSELKRNMLQSDDQQLVKLIFPLFVFACLDLISSGLDIRQFVKSYLVDENVSQEQKTTIESLIAYSDLRDVSQFPELQKWSENKYRAEFDKASWKRFSSYLIKSDAHMLLRIVNLNIQVTMSRVTDDIEQETDVKVDLQQQQHHQLPSSSFLSFQSDDIKHEKIQTDEPMMTNRIITESSSSRVKRFADCVEQIKSASNDTPLACVNGAFSFYLDDSERDVITSSTMSPNSELVAFTAETSSIYIYKPMEYDAVGADRKRYYRELVGGHAGGPIFKSKFTHDSKFLISCGDDGQACLWRTRDDNNDDYDQWESQENDHTVEEDKNEQWFKTATQSPVVCYYSAHLYPVWDVEPFSKLNLFATGSRDNTSRLWSFDRIYPLRVFSGHHSDVNCVKFHPNGTYLATGSSDKTVRLWSVQGGEFVRLFSSHRSRVFCVAFSPDGNYLASSGEDKRVKLWDLRWGHLYKEFKGHSDLVHSLEFDSTSQLLCSAGRDKTVKMWKIHQQQNSSTNIASSSSTTASAKLDLSGSSDFASSFKSTKSGGAQQQNNATGGGGGEFISSVGVNFNVFSIQRDEQNVFYFTGARKPLTHTIGCSSSIRSKVNGPSFKLEGSRSVFNINQSKSQKSSKQTAAVSHQQPPPQPPQPPMTTHTTESNKPNTRRRTVTTGSIAQSAHAQHHLNSTPSFLLDNDDLYEV